MNGGMGAGLPSGLGGTLPGAYRVEDLRSEGTQRAAPPSVVALPVARAPDPSDGGRGARTARVIGDDNGWGLSRDKVVVSRAFAEAGWRVLTTDRFDVGPRPVVAVNVHLEVVAEPFFGSARWNVIVPNPEWWSAQWNDFLLHPSARVWAKTADADRIFRELGARVSRVGFRSVDRLDESVPRERVFLHVAGNAHNKGTALLVSSWVKEWPRLIVVGSDRLLSVTAFPPWVTRLDRVSEDYLRALQNRCLFHIYPSSYEGFGHAQWEGLSCGAIVFVPDVPPFDEVEVGFLRIPVGEGSAPLGGGSNLRARHASRAFVVEAVARAEAMSDAEVGGQRVAARATWERSAAAFRANMDLEISSIVGPSEVGASASSGVLGALPSMRYVGRVNCVTGYGMAARHQVWALRRHGLRLEVVDAGSAGDPDPDHQDPFVQEARRSTPGIGETRGTIFHLAPNCVRPEDLQCAHPHVLVSVWETTRLPREWVPIVNRFDQVWCATEWQRWVYALSGVDDRLLRVVPFSVDPSLYVEDGGTLAEVRRAGRTVFGAVFQWTERKDPAALLNAYFRAFSASDSVTLVLKSYEGDNPATSVEGRIRGIIDSIKHTSPPEVTVISRSLASAEMHAFYRSIDCYVSAHRGEAFGFPIAEALCTGKLVIATDWSAPAEYAAGLFRGVRYTLVPPHNMDWQPFYTSDQLWACVDVGDLAAAMREVVDRRPACPVDRARARFAVRLAQVGPAARAAIEAL